MEGREVKNRGGNIHKKRSPNKLIKAIKIWEGPNQRFKKKKGHPNRKEHERRLGKNLSEGVSESPYKGATRMEKTR